MAEHPSSRPGRQIAPRLTAGDGRLRRTETLPASADQGLPPDLRRPADERAPALEPPLTIAEVARHYRMSERTVRRRIKDGTLQKEPGLGRLVRISVEQLRKLGRRE